mmetsp:Transcript_16486/g.28310  ORF Transcript_16486/g.28310 Transcript_16486/m.28310 type:complete len:200 (-) Transcript_16486:158-757(-)
MSMWRRRPCRAWPCAPSRQRATPWPRSPAWRRVASITRRGATPTRAHRKASCARCRPLCVHAPAWLRRAPASAQTTRRRCQPRATPACRRKTRRRTLSAMNAPRRSLPSHVLLKTLLIRPVDQHQPPTHRLTPTTNRNECDDANRAPPRPTWKSKRSRLVNIVNRARACSQQRSTSNHRRRTLAAPWTHVAPRMTVEFT